MFELATKRGGRFCEVKALITKAAFAAGVSSALAGKEGTGVDRE